MGDPLTFLGLSEDHSLSPDIVILPVPYELTTSYGQGTVEGPESCLLASTQVELYDPRLSEDIPAGAVIRTEAAWSSEAGTLNEAKLLFESLSKSLSKPARSGRKLTEGSNRRTLGSSSRPVKSGSAKPMNESVALDRWATLAGIKK